MADIRVRNLGDEIVGEFKDRAKRHGRSLEAELRELLTAEALRPRRQLADDLGQFRNTIRSKYGALPDSTASIRQDRDERG